MKFIKNKIKFVFWTILVSFGLSISNVWAMEEEEVPQDPQSAAMLPVLATPLRSVQREQGVPQSSIKATINITNYCRQIIETLNNKERNDQGKLIDSNLSEKEIKEKVLKLLNSFYKKIPSTLKNSTRKRTKGQSDAAFELQLRKDALDYHKSLFFCLAMCLKMSVSTNVVSSSEDLVATVSHNDDYSEISLKVKTVEDKKFSITFNIVEKLDESCVSTELTEIDGDHEWNKKYKVDVKIEMLSLQSMEDASVIDISAGYKTDNFFKMTTTALVPVSGDSNILSVPKPLDLGYAAAAAAPAEPQTDTGLQDRLGFIFNAIPSGHRVYLEQYYQFLMFSLVNFMGSCLCFAEFITGDGRADLIIRTEREGKLVGSIIELKRAQTAEVALVQIADREYINSFDEEFQIVGISISGRDGVAVVVDCKKSVISPVPVVTEDGSSWHITSHIPKPESKIQKAKVAFDDATKKKESAEAVLKCAKRKRIQARGAYKKALAEKAVGKANVSLAKAEKAREEAEKKYKVLLENEAKAIAREAEKKEGAPAKKRQKREAAESEEETSEGEQK